MKWSFVIGWLPMIRALYFNTIGHLQDRLLLIGNWLNLIAGNKLASIDKSIWFLMLSKKTWTQKLIGWWRRTIMILISIILINLSNRSRFQKIFTGCWLESYVYGQILYRNLYCWSFVMEMDPGRMSWHGTRDHNKWAIIIS